MTNPKPNVGLKLMTLRSRPELRSKVGLLGLLGGVCLWLRL